MITVRKKQKRLVSLFRNEIFEEVSKSDLSGMIFTYIWAFDLQEDWDYIHHVENIFESKRWDSVFCRAGSGIR